MFQFDHRLRRAQGRSTYPYTIEYLPSAWISETPSVIRAFLETKYWRKAHILKLKR